MFEEDKPYKAAQRKQRDFDKQDKIEVDDAINDLLSTQRGRRFLCWLLEIGKYGTVPFTGNALTGAFLAGEVNVGHQIWERLMEANPQALFNMLVENSNERHARAEQYAGTGTEDA